MSPAALARDPARDAGGSARVHPRWEQRHRLAFDLTLVLERDLLDWQEHRQVADGAKIATINRASASLRGLFAWAHTEGTIVHNVAERLHDLASDADSAPRGTPPEAVE